MSKIVQHPKSPRKRIDLQFLTFPCTVIGEYDVRCEFGAIPSVSDSGCNWIGHVGAQVLDGAYVISEHYRHAHHLAGEFDN